MIPVNEPDIRKEDILNAMDTLLSGDISGVRGKYIKEFEDSLAKYCCMKDGISVCNGTAALHLALLSLKLKQGDEVIIPSLTMAATAFAVLYVGAKPILVDVDEETWNINPDLIEDKITPHTKAIIPVHLYGNPCDMDPIMEISNKHNLKVVEDCAEALGATYNGIPIGSFGDLSCHSFYATKMITTGEGGMVLTNNSELTKRIKSLRNMAFGNNKRYIHNEVGYNYRLTNLQSAIGVSQLSRLKEIVRMKKEIYDTYIKIYNLIGRNIKIHKHNDGSSYWMNAIEIDDRWDRDFIRYYIKSKHKIDTGDIFESLNRQPFIKSGKFPVSESISDRAMLIPSSIKLTYHNQNYVLNNIEGCLTNENIHRHC